MAINVPRFRYQHRIDCEGRTQFSAQHFGGRFGTQPLGQFRLSLLELILCETVVGEGRTPESAHKQPMRDPRSRTLAEPQPLPWNSNVRVAIRGLLSA